MAQTCALSETVINHDPVAMKQSTPTSGEVRDSYHSMGTERFSKQGQKYPTPPDDDATRMFYESLFHENSSSKMAIKYCVERGILSTKELEQVWIEYRSVKDREVLAIQALKEKRKRRFASLSIVRSRLRRHRFNMVAHSVGKQ
eukprot:TRINITY_DN70664_c0_g1_i1.p2 TRINITY_DN70664_c0_g1~~TRINITY_DN70664_c0_g1_i1.p2  ORF type:complete len:144 (-),score=23.85 TRINITY_DN70664_c0_g1_i1:367-798(-)